MGGAIADRLRGAGHELRLYDVAPAAGVASEPSLAAAARKAEVALLCLPDAPAVEASVPGLVEARPAACVDLTSSDPAVTRRVGATLAGAGIPFIDCALSGGVQGAREGRLTAMAGGDQALLERVRPVLARFASSVFWAGPLGAGHAVKAINNTLSAVSLTATAEALVLAVALGAGEDEAVARFNSGPARSQNSEVKFPRDILSRTYAAGFTVELMRKDLATALRMAEAGGVATPLLRATIAAWDEVGARVEPGADFTRVHAVIADRSTPTGAAPSGFEVGVLVSALAGLNLIAAKEMLLVAEAEGLEAKTTLAIVNASTGRSEATRAGATEEPDLESVRAAATLAARAGVWTPLLDRAAKQ